MSDTKLVKPKVKRKGTPRNPPNAGKGRRKGSVNKSTALAREAIARLVDGNAERLQEWLDQIAEIDGPKAAFACLMDVLEYHVPKLQRTEVSGPGGGPQEHTTTIVIQPVRPSNG